MSTSLTRDDYIEYIKLQVTGGGILELEIEDPIIGRFVDSALVELRRYIDETKMVQAPFARCIDLTGFNHSAIVNVYRTEGFTGDTISSTSDSMIDPMYAQQWMAFSSAGMSYSLNDYVLNYLAYNTLLQMRNNTSTDLNFKEDKNANKLYINCTSNLPKFITIEYVPVFTDVSEITSDYWIDVLKRLSLGMVKVALGRIRTRFTQSNALWTQDGETMLQEGNEELKELREVLRTNSTYFFPKD